MLTACDANAQPYSDSNDQGMLIQRTETMSLNRVNEAPSGKESQSKMYEHKMANLQTLAIEHTLPETGHKKQRCSHPLTFLVQTNQKSFNDQ